MAKGFKHGAGGGSGSFGGLNFEIVAYATEDELKSATPKENTIGIITTNKITGWMLTPGDIEVNKQSANLYTTTSATTGAYLDDDGSEVSYNTYLITKYIQLPDNTKSLTATFPYTDEDVIAFYNSDKTFISTVQYEEGLATYSVPDGTRYIRVSYHVDKEPPTIYANYVAEGTVLIQTGTDSLVGFNALKKNGIQVYPMSAKQYISGAWVDVTAMSYQGGEWVEWLPNNRLFWLGDYNEITGGWTVSKMGNNSVGTMLKGDTTIGVSHSTSNSYCHTVLYCNNKIDFTNIDTVYINVLDYTGNMSLIFGPKSTLEGNTILAKELSVGENAIDVRGISGAYLFILETYTASKNGSYNVDKIWME